MIGPSTTQTPYLVATVDTVAFTSILSAGDVVAGSLKKDGTPFREVGVPDGLGAFDNGDGTFTLLVNHEIGPTLGVVRAHGSAGAFVDRLVIDKATLQVKSASDLGQTVFTFNSTTGSYAQGATAFNRLCSADLPSVSAFYDASTGFGTQTRIFMNGEESGAEGRAFAWIVNGTESGRVYELPKLGKFSWENSVAAPGSGAKTVVIGQDDSTPGQLYLYAGDKQATGSEIDKAGLTNGKLYGIKVPAFALETNATAVASAGAAFTLQEMGPNGDVSRFTGAQLQAESTAEGVTEFLRPEDGAWDPSNPNRYYFNTTNAATSPSRLWALDFVDVKRPELGGTVKMLLDGTEGQVMLDNLTVTADGKVILLEDVGNNARLGKVFEYDPVTDTIKAIAEHDPARFSGLTPPFNQDEESSGVIDVTDILGSPGKQVLLLDVQAHYAFTGANATEVVEGGQIIALTIDRTINGTSGNDTLNGGIINDAIFGREGDDVINGGAGNDVIDGGFGNDTVSFNVTTGGADAVNLGDGSDIVNVSASAAGQIRLTFTSAEVGNGAASDSNTMANQDGGLAARLQAEGANDTLVGGISRFDDEGTTFISATAGLTFDVRDLVAGTQRGNLFELVALGTAAADTLTAVQASRPYYVNAGAGDDVIIGGSANDFLVGGAGNDTLSGGAGNDTVLGGAGNDIFTGGSGDDSFDGAAGIDRAIFSYALSAATVGITAAGVGVIVGPDGTDTFRGVEQFQFSDRTIDNADGAPLVDDLFYLARNPDVAASGQDADAHYAAFGFKEGRDPNALFSTKNYLAANQDVAKSGLNPLAQYDQTGWKEGRDPSALFDNEFYLAKNPDVKAAGIDPLKHYLEYGQSEGRAISTAIGKASDIKGGFDAEYYLLSNADVANAASATADSFAYARSHFDQYGWKEGRNPNAVFDTKGYLSAYSDVARAGINPLNHYDAFGYKESRDPSAGFDSSAYLAAYGDVAKAGIDPMQHYLQYGLYEGRSAFGDGAFGSGLGG